MADIQRICVVAKPSRTNPQYFEWQTASVCLFVPEHDMQVALEIAKQELHRRHWEIVDYDEVSTLIEERVREQGGAVWDAFQYAQSGRVFVKCWPHHFGAGDSCYQWMRPARISEEFMDRVIADAGGRRLSDEEKGAGVRNADYRVGRFIFELKDIQEEALRKQTYQQRIAGLFAPYFPDQSRILIDPTVLSKPDFAKYIDLLGKPIQRIVKSASKQIKASKEVIGDPTLMGGIIVLNTGFGSFPHQAFAQQVQRYATKDSSQIAAAVSIDTWSSTNGFDTYVFFEFSPSEPEHDEVTAIRASFDKHFERMMTDLVTGRLSSSMERSDPLKPTVFCHAGIDFAWQPPSVPLPWNADAHHDC